MTSEKTNVDSPAVAVAAPTAAVPVAAPPAALPVAATATATEKTKGDAGPTSSAGDEKQKKNRSQCALCGKWGHGPEVCRSRPQGATVFVFNGGNFPNFRLSSGPGVGGGGGGGGGGRRRRRKNKARRAREEDKPEDKAGEKAENKAKKNAGEE